MAVLEFIEKLREKSEASRRRIVFLSTLIITGLIFIFWLTAFSLPSPKNQKDTDGPFKSLKEDALNFYGFIQENIKRIQ